VPESEHFSSNFAHKTAHEGEFRDWLRRLKDRKAAAYIANALGVVARAKGKTQEAKEAGATREFTANSSALRQKQTWPKKHPALRRPALPTRTLVPSAAKDRTKQFSLSHAFCGKALESNELIYSEN
jgi:DNA-binding phage protein